MNRQNVGTHILLNIFDCNRDYIACADNIRDILESAINESGLTKVGESFHQFTPEGATGVMLLSESHICIHTWPEYHMAAIDIFCCSSEEKARKVSDILVKKFESGRFDQQVCYR
jgi:S-adenosylmethionine decarboxylase proenzyme